MPVRMRILIIVFFTLAGFLFGNWVSRVPDIKAHVGASPGSLGLALLGMPAGAVVTMVVAGRLCTRYGSSPVTLVGAISMSLTTMMPAIAPNVVALGAALLVLGASFGGLEVGMNSVAVDITREAGRPIMPTFHAAYSAGGMLGAALGGLLVGVLDPFWHLAVVGLIGLAVTAIAGSMLIRRPDLADPEQTDPAARPAMGSATLGGEYGRARILLVVFGIIALCTAYGEGALADWGALHLQIDLHTSTGVAATGYVGFSFAMLTGRLCGERLLTRLGRTVVLVGGALTAAVGILAAAVVPSLAIAIAGFIFAGAGVANLFPAAMARAGALSGAHGVAFASTVGYCGFLLGPPVIGLIADRVGLPIALTTIAALALTAALAAWLAHREEARWDAPEA